MGCQTMTKQHYESKQSALKILPFGGLLLVEYQTFDGEGAELIRKRREFCSEFFTLPASMQEMVIAAQSRKSLERLLQTISRFKNRDTGELTHFKEIEMIQSEIESRNHKKRKKITMDQLEKALGSLRNRRH